MSITNSARSMDFAYFALKVIDHIDDYTVKQYGDKGVDIATDYTYEKCLEEIKKYVARGKTNARGEVESLRDLLKIAHYAQLGYSAKLKNSSPANSDSSTTGQP